MWLTMNGCCFSTCCCVNLFIHLRSASELLPYLVNILTQNVSLRLNGYTPLLLLYELIFSCDQLVSYFHIVPQNVWLRIDCSFLLMLASVLTCAFACVQIVRYFIFVERYNTRCVKKWCSFLHLLLCECVHSLVFRR